MTEKDALIFVEHILDSMKNIEDFTKGVPKESFMKNIAPIVGMTNKEDSHENQGDPSY